MLADHYSPTGSPTQRGCPARARFGNAPVWLVGVRSECEGDAELQERLRRLALLRHPGLTPLIDFGTADESPELGLREGQTFLVLEADEGATGPDLDVLSPEALLAVTAQLLSALEHLHANEQVFGDLDAAQVSLSTRTGALPRARLYGVGARGGESVLKTAAPERRQGKPATRSSDLYGLGALVGAALGDGTGPAASVLRPVLRGLTSESPSARTANAGEALQELLEWHPESIQFLKGELPETECVGREAELENLLLALEGALLDRPRGPRVWIQVVGEPGIGRSRLIAEVATRLRLQGVACLELTGLEAGTGGRCDEVLELATKGPVLVTVRDLDSASADAQVAALKLVKQAAGAQLNLVVVLTLNTDLGGGFAKELAKAAALSTPYVVELGRLARGPLGVLINTALGLEVVPERLLDLTYGWCGGNPGLARLALTRLFEAGALEHEGRSTHVYEDRLAEIPGGPAPALESASPSGLKRDSRRVLRALSVAAGAVSPVLLERICGLGSSQFEKALRPLLGRTQGTLSRFSFVARS